MAIGWKAALSSDRGVAAIVAMAVILTSPALGTGLVADDFFHKVMLGPAPGIRGVVHAPLDLFAFATGDVWSNRLLMDEGVFPWWADPNVRLAFWRPLSCGTHLVDHWLWGDSAPLAHLHSMVWFALVLLGVACLYRRLLVPPWSAGLALLLYAVDDARAPAVAWIANRNALVSMALAIPALVFHDRWRRDSERRAGWLAPAMLALGLLAGETASAVAGYLAAYALCLDRGKARERLLSLVPYAIVLVAWRAIYVASGHGVAGSGVYVDPLRDPIGFLTVSATRLPLLLAGALLGPWTDLWESLALLAPGLRPWLLGWSALVVVLFVVLLLPVVKSDRVARFFAVGAVLASLPMCSTFVHDRLLMVPCLGTMAVVARVLACWATEPGLRRPARTAAVAVLAMVHLVAGPLLAPVRAYAAVNGPSRLLQNAYDSIPTAPSIAHKTVVLVNPPFDPFASYFPLARQVEGKPRPEHLRWLAAGATSLRIERTDERTLLVEAQRGWLSTTSERMLRDPDTAPARLGDLVNLSDVSFQVTRVSDGRPREIRVRFRLALEDPLLVWLEWDHDGRGYAPFQPPPIGSSVQVEPVDMRRALFPLANSQQGTAWKGESAR
jgi:hypothetical protein